MSRVRYEKSASQGEGERKEARQREYQEGQSSVVATDLFSLKSRKKRRQQREERAVEGAGKWRKKFACTAPRGL